jgi:hypothetical protein
MIAPQDPSNEPQSSRQQWHRLFGLMLEDQFYGSPYRVEVEVDLARQAQFLDVVVVEQEKNLNWPEVEELPDGLETLQAHNLITFKSHQESLNDWAVKELIGHYVNYRKQISPPHKLIPQHDFGLYAVCHRYPQKLAAFLTPCPLAGVYQLNWGSDNIRLIVLSHIGPEPKNDLWHLFSHQRDQVELACRRYHPHHQEKGTAVMRRLIETYQLEFPDMAYTFEQFTKEFVADHLNMLSLDERLKNVSADEVLQHYSPDEVLQRYSLEERLKNLSPEERLKNLSPEDKLKNISPDEIADHLTPEALQQLLERLQQRQKQKQGPSGKA